MCGSWNLVGTEGEYYTGVEAPDGGQERWRFTGWKCKQCGAEGEGEP